MKTYSVLLLGIVLLISGCANLNTVGRSTELPGHGLAVHLDAPQRLAIANMVGLVCAEPSPDALQAYASALGASVTGPSERAVSIAQSLATSAGSIGLRTQSITMMRDALYRICELHKNGALSPDAAAQLLQRSQELSLAVLAIEQLTGAVVARQVAFNTNSPAAAAAAINDTRKELDKAKASEVAKRTASDAAQTALDAQQKAVDNATAKANAAREKAKGTQAAIDKLTPALADAKTALSKAQINQVEAKLKVVGLQATIKAQTATKQTLAIKVVDLHSKSVVAKKLRDDAVVTNEKQKIDDAEAALKNATDAETSANAELAQANNELTDSNNALVAASRNQGDSEKLVQHAQLSVDQIAAQLDAAKKDPDQVAADKAATDLKAATDELKARQTALDDAKNSLLKAQADTNEIEKLGIEAKASANSAATGASLFSTTADRYGIDKETVNALASATGEIVRIVVNKGHLTDTCGLVLMRLSSDGKNYADKQVLAEKDASAILDSCKNVIQASVDAYKAGMYEGTVPILARLGDACGQLLESAAKTPRLLAEFPPLCNEILAKAISGQNYQANAGGTGAPTVPSPAAQSGKPSVPKRSTTLSRQVPLVVEPQFQITK